MAFKKGHIGYKYWLGKHLSEETKRKLSESHKMNPNNSGYFEKGHTVSAETKEKVSIAHSGKHLSEEHKNKLSIALMGRTVSVENRKKISERQKGNKSHLWKGGISKLHKRIRASAEFKKWRKKVFERDNYTCQECKKRGGELHPHHIKSFTDYPELRFDINNGITLCRECHKLTDNFAGRKRVQNASPKN